MLLMLLTNLYRTEIVLKLVLRERKILGPVDRGQRRGRLPFDRAVLWQCSRSKPRLTATERLRKKKKKSTAVDRGRTRSTGGLSFHTVLDPDVIGHL